MTESESKSEQKSNGTPTSSGEPSGTTGEASTSSDATSTSSSSGSTSNTSAGTSADSTGATGASSGATSGGAAPSTDKAAGTTTDKSTDKTDAKSTKKSSSSDKSEEKGKRRAEPEKKAPASNTVNSIRSGVATAVWLLAVLAAVILAIGALMVTLDFNQKNAFVAFFVTTANNIDFGVFKDFEPGKGETQADVQTKKVLVNWGIAALIYLVGGKILERIIRP